MPIGPNRVAELGELALVLALVLAAYAVAAALVGWRRGDEEGAGKRLVDSAVHAAQAAAALVTLASLVLAHALLVDDLSIRYVFAHSDPSMPWIYKLTAYWGGLDGSLLFWAWIQAMASAVALRLYRERLRPLVAWTTVLSMATLLFFLALLVFDKRPFDLFLVRLPERGQGLSPLLQNPYMAVHPPALYFGLVLLAVPYALAMAGLVRGRFERAWLEPVRRWVLAAWLCLSLGLVLGMLWAYEVLGWGGYWGWDPVENAGLLAWLTATALLHTLKVEKQRGILRAWNVSLVIASFTLTLIATFLTRSGFVESVHAFGADPVLKVAFLALIVIVILTSSALLLVRLPRLRGPARLESRVSREGAILLGARFLAGASLFVLGATLLPSLAELVAGSRLALTATFYNRWAGLALVLLLLAGLTPLLAWRRLRPRRFLAGLVWPLAFTALVTALLSAIPRLRVLSPFLIPDLRLPLVLVDFALASFLVSVIIKEFITGTRARRTRTGTGPLASLVGLTRRAHRRYGGYVVHLGIALMFVGFAGDALRREENVTLSASQAVHLDGYELRLLDLGAAESLEKQSVSADLLLVEKGRERGRLRPARWFFNGREGQPVSHIAIDRGWWEDVYVVLHAFDLEKKTVDLKIVLHPLVNAIWLGFFVLVLGGLLAFAPASSVRAAAERTPRPSALPVGSRPGWARRAKAPLLLLAVAAMALYQAARGAALLPSLVWLGGLLAMLLALDEIVEGGLAMVARDRPAAVPDDVQAAQLTEAGR